MEYLPVPSSHITTLAPDTMSSKLTTLTQPTATQRMSTWHLTTLPHTHNYSGLEPFIPLWTCSAAYVGMHDDDDARLLMLHPPYVTCINNVCNLSFLKSRFQTTFHPSIYGTYVHFNVKNIASIQLPTCPLQLNMYTSEVRSDRN